MVHPINKSKTKSFEEQNTHWAINHLSDNSPDASAKNIDYIKAVAGFGVIFFSMLMLFINAFNVINNLLYMTQNILKATLFKRGLADAGDSHLAKISDDLPIYSVLVPLYKEELKAASILKAMQNMNYPKDKLDVKFIIESDDLLTIRALAGLNLPNYIHVIKVPPSDPRTKPKALNYAMTYVTGKYVTIYDAEDQPDPDQILKAVHAFNTLPDNYACIQAKLNFYNADENLLTKFFSIEYSIWFDYLLKGLSLMNLPVTLGGTSNHFRVDRLKEVGYWDAFNVTEDADLGLRLYLHGYKVHLINSTTIEESPTDIATWMPQRARWIKGFIQTILVFIKVKKDYSKLGFIQIMSVYIFVGLSTYSFFCLPWLFLVLLLQIDQYIYYLWLSNTLFSITYMYIIICFVIFKKDKSISILNIVALIFWPLYFLLHTFACYRAIWETLVSPFKWNKTPHGNSIQDLE